MQCGYTREDVIGKIFWECGWWNRSAEIQAWVKAGFQQAIRGEPFRGVTKYYCANSSERVVEFACMPVKDEAGNVLFVVPTGIDVTERVQAKRDHQAAAILESITDGFVAVDRGWRFTYVNRQAARLLGHPVDYFFGKVIWNVFPGLIGSEFARAYHRAASDWVASSITAYYPDHDRWYEAQTYPSEDGISIYFRDASEQVRAEEKRQALSAQLALQARIFDTALSNTPDLTYTFDLEGRFTYLNRALLAVLQKTIDQVVGKNFFELDYPPELAARLQRQIQQVIDTKSQVQDETPYTGAFGTRFYEYIFVPVLAPDGTVEAVAGSTRDITERRQGEVATRRRALQLQQLAEVASRINSAHDIHSVVGVVTEEARNIVGAELAAMSVVLNPSYPQPITVISAPSTRRPEPDSPGGDALMLHAAVNAEFQPVRLSQDSLASDPRWKILEMAAFAIPTRGGWLAAPIVGRNAKTIGLIELADKQEGDFTEDDEAILVQLSRLAAIAIENAKLYEELKENDQRKDEFLAMLAHELRNPLAAIGNAVGVTRRSSLQEHIDWSRSVIIRQMNHLTRIIDDLLDVSRISRGKIELRRQIHDLTPVVESAAATVKPLVDERQHALHVTIDRGNLWVNADPTRLEQVVVNLLNNAAKYSENAGKIWLTAYNLGKEVVISVKDQGIGIAPEKLPLMFELFAQGDRTLARSEGGPGHRADHRQEARRDARWQRHGSERRTRQGERVHDSTSRRQPSCRAGGGRGRCSEESRGRKMQGSRGGRQPGYCARHGEHPQPAGPRGVHRSQRSPGIEGRRHPPTRFHPARHRSAGHEWLRGRIPPETGSDQQERLHRRGLRLRPGRGPPSIERGGLRPPSDQACRPRVLY